MGAGHEKLLSVLLRFGARIWIVTVFPEIDPLIPVVKKGYFRSRTLVELSYNLLLTLSSCAGKWVYLEIVFSRKVRVLT